MTYPNTCPSCAAKLHTPDSVALANPDDSRDHWSARIANGKLQVALMWTTCTPPENAEVYCSACFTTIKEV